MKIKLQRVLKLDLFWVLILAIGIFLVLLVQHLRFSYLLGHDVYFHYFISQIIIENGLSWPNRIPFYWEGISFGYPPLLHTTTAILQVITQLDLSLIYKFVPALFSAFSIILVYFLFKQYQMKKPLIPTMLFTLIPVFLWPLYAGEYARFFGFVLTLLSLVFLSKYEQSHHLGHALISTISLGLGIMSNLVSAIFVTTFFGYLAWFEYFQKKQYHRFVMLTLGILVAGVWWIRALYLYGMDYLYKVITIHQKSSLALLSLIACLVILIVYNRYKRNWPHIFWMWLIVGVILHSILFIAVPFAYFLSRFLQKIKEKTPVFVDSLRLHILLLVLSLSSLTLLTSGHVIDHDAFINPDVIEAATWIKQNTKPTTSIMSFLKIFYSPIPYLDKSLELIVSLNHRDELLPPLIHRQTYSWMGYEWNNDAQQLEVYAEFHQDLCQASFIQRAQKYQIYPDYLWLNKDSPEFKNPHHYCQDLEEPLFENVFENNRILIYQVHWNVQVLY